MILVISIVCGSRQIVASPPFPYITAMLSWLGLNLSFSRIPSSDAAEVKE